MQTIQQESAITVRTEGKLTHIIADQDRKHIIFTVKEADGDDIISLLNGEDKKVKK